MNSGGEAHGRRRRRMAMNGSAGTEGEEEKQRLLRNKTKMSEEIAARSFGTRIDMGRRGGGAGGARTERRCAAA